MYSFIAKVLRTIRIYRLGGTETESGGKKQESCLSQKKKITMKNWFLAENSVRSVGWNGFRQSVVKLGRETDVSFLFLFCPVEIESARENNL